MATKLIIVGAAGRMGRRISALAAQSEEFEVVAAVEAPGCPELGKDLGLVVAVESLAVRICDSFPQFAADVVIDFSLPEASERTLQYCLDKRVALVCGTTGLSQQQRQKFDQAGRDIPIIYGTNMSVGMNVLFVTVGKLASALGDDYDIEIVEQHHRFKKDAPSGSALTLAENICKATGRDFPASLVYGRSGRDVPRKDRTIGVHAVRAGDIVGVHSVMYSTLGETVTITHTAHSRDTFARGALRAAKWLVGKDPGLYSMADVLGLR